VDGQGEASDCADVHAAGVEIRRLGDIAPSARPEPFFGIFQNFRRTGFNVQVVNRSALARYQWDPKSSHKGEFFTSVTRRDEKAIFLVNKTRPKYVLFYEYQLAQVKLGEMGNENFEECFSSHLGGLLDRHFFKLNGPGGFLGTAHYGVCVQQWFVLFEGFSWAKETHSVQDGSER
jgi:hypothetical protein